MLHAAGSQDLNSPFAQTSATALAQAAASNKDAVAQSLAQAAARAFAHSLFLMHIQSLRALQALMYGCDQDSMQEGWLSSAIEL